MEKIEAEELKIHGGGRTDCDLGVELERVGKGSFQQRQLNAVKRRGIC